MSVDDPAPGEPAPERPYTLGYPELSQEFRVEALGRAHGCGCSMVMRALTVRPGRANSTRLEEIPEPPRSDGSILVRARALGMCGTDREIVSGEYGWAPPGEDRLVLGHESLGVVEEAPSGSGFAAGDLVVGIVRRPDPVPCPACAAGEWDMCPVFNAINWLHENSCVATQFSTSRGGEVEARTGAISRQ
jgi:Zn-dependent alcohol dehydrogenase